jgi:hypothetical protein
MRLLALFSVLFTIGLSSSRADSGLVSVRLAQANGTGFGGQEAPPSGVFYRWDPDFRCADGHAPGYRGTIRSLFGSDQEHAGFLAPQNCGDRWHYLQTDACSGKSRELDFGQLTIFRRLWSVSGVVDNRWIAFDGGIYECDSTAKPATLLICQSDFSDSNVSFQILIHSGAGGGAPLATIFMKRHLPASNETELRQVKPFAALKTEAGFSDPAGDCDLKVLAGSASEELSGAIRATMRLRLDGNYETTELSCAPSAH